MGQDEFKQSLPEKEKPTPDDAKVARMLGGLRRAEAPKDFDFHLKARIAAGSPAEMRRPRFLPVLTYALPLGLLLIITGFVAYSSYFTLDNGVSPVVAESPRSKDAVADRTMSEKGPSIKNDFAKTPVESVNAQPPKREETASGDGRASNSVDGISPAANKRSGGRSADFGQGGRIKTMNPRGFNPDNLVSQASANKMTTKSEISTGEVLKMLGVNADLVEDAWRVKAVNAGSPAERAGVQTGDVILAINDRKIGKTIEFSRQFSGNSVTVLRNEKPVRIDLLKKQP